MKLAEGDAALAWRSTTPLAGRACVFVDRDGVINERVHDGYVLKWQDFHFRPDAFEALRILASARLPVIVVSNQSCVGRGLLAQPELLHIMRRMREALADNGAPLTAWYCCPHAPTDGCDCRKPKPGMLRRAAREFGLDLARSFLIGDAESDIAAGIAAGCTAIKIDPEIDTSFAAAARSAVDAFT